METIATICEDALYESDFYSWTRRQAELMRAGRLAELDLPNLVEEIESLGARNIMPCDPPIGSSWCTF